MKLGVTVQGNTYIPMVATPAVTNGSLSLPNVARMLFDPDAYCDADHDDVLTAHQVTSAGKLVQVNHTCFRELALTETTTDVAAMLYIKSMVVPEASLKALLSTLTFGLGRAGKLRGRLPLWDPNAQLPKSLEESVSEFILKPLSRGSARANSSYAKQLRLRAALDKIVAAAAKANVALDLRELPGRKRDFLALIVHLDSTVKMCTETFDKHYTKLLGIRWRQGSKAKDLKPLFDLFSLPLKP